MKHFIWVALFLAAAESASARADSFASADSLADSIGVVTHFSYPSYARNEFFPVDDFGEPDASKNLFESVLLPRLRELRVRHLRDTLPSALGNLDESQRHVRKTLGKMALLSYPSSRWTRPVDFMIKTSIAPDATRNPDAPSLEQDCFVPSLRVAIEGGTYPVGRGCGLGGLAIDGPSVVVSLIEGPNEPDHCPSGKPCQNINSGEDGGGICQTSDCWLEKSLAHEPAWPLRVNRVMSALARKLEEAGLSSLFTVVAPSWVHVSRHATASYEKESLPAYLKPTYVESEHANLHHYAWRTAPFTSLGEQVKATLASSGRSTFVASELGYFTAPLTSGHPENTHPDLAAKFTLQQLVKLYSLGSLRSYVYELLDQESVHGESNLKEQNFGLLSRDGKPKPAFTAIKNLMQLFDESLVTRPGPPEGERPVPQVSVSPGVQKLLFKHKDGSWLVVLWHEQVNYGGDVLRYRDFLIPARIVIKDAERAELFRPRVSSQPIGKYPARAPIELKLPDDVTVLRLTR